MLVEPTLPVRRRWTAVQLAVVVGFVAFSAYLAMNGPTALQVLWFVIIPVVPLSLLISPAIWRNVCPLATLNVAASSPQNSAGRPVSTRAAQTLGIVLLIVLIPTRHLVLNDNAAVVLGLFIALAVVSVVLGVLFPVKSGFCNSACPVLPVERLYGHRPMMQVTNPRCVPCTTCTASTCIDLAPTKSVGQTLGPSRRNHRWLLTPFGAFAGAFPGIVTGYFLVTDNPASLLEPYVSVVTWGAVSLVVAGVVTTLFAIEAERMATHLAAIAAGLYYWFTVPAIMEEFGLGIQIQWGLWAVTLGVVVAWWIRASFREVVHQP